MSLDRVSLRLFQYSSAVSRLAEALSMSFENDIVLDGTIQRFEFTYELAWKALKDFLELRGLVDVDSPRQVLKAAFKAGLIDADTSWLRMLGDRNLTTHTYHHETACDIVGRVRDIYIGLFTDLRDRLNDELEEVRTDDSGHTG